MALPVGRKVLLDTNVLIDFLRADLHAEWVFGGSHRVFRFLSAVVLMELHLGANTPKRKKAIERIETAFPKNRIIAPTPSLFSRAGGLYPILYGGRGEKSDRLGPINDLLIALTAREVGAIIVTSNKTEFSRIAEELPGLEVLAPNETS